MPRRKKESKEAQHGRPGPGAIWSGTITFGLVSVPVELYAGVRSPYSGLRLVTEEGVPLRREYFCPRDERPVSSDEIVRGAEQEDGQFVQVTDEELEALEPRRSREIDLRRFVDRQEISPAYFDRPYVLAPAGESTKAYRLLAETMERKGRAGIATFVMRGKEYLVAILADEGILRAETLRFAAELREVEQLSLPEQPQLPRKLVQQLAAAIKAQSAGELPREELVDEQATQLRELARQKHAAGVDVRRPPAPEEAPEAEVVDIMQLLKRRFDQRPEEGPRAAESRQLSTARQRAGRRQAGRPSTRAVRALAQQTRSELYRRAQELEVEGRSQMTKQELIEAIRRAG